MTWLRMITAFVLIPFVLVGLFLTSVPTFALISGVIWTLAALEWAQLSEFRSVVKQILYVVVFAVGLLGLYWLPAPYSHYFCLASMGLWAVLLFWTLTFKGTFPTLLRHTGSRAIIGLAVLWSSWLGLNLIRAHDQGILWIFCVLLIVWASDTAAYFVGKAWGKRLFSPIISPKKTWAGFWGGFMGAFIVAMGCFALMGIPQTQWIYFVPMSVVLILLAIYGDLFESLVKRVANKKDSGNILPGHGGILDRIDSLLPTMPFFAAFLIGI